MTASFLVDAELGLRPAGPEQSGASFYVGPQEHSSHDGLFARAFDVKIHFKKAHFK